MDKEMEKAPEDGSERKARMMMAQMSKVRVPAGIAS